MDATFGPRELKLKHFKRRCIKVDAFRGLSERTRMTQNSHGRVLIRIVRCVLVSLLADQSSSSAAACGRDDKSSGPLEDSAHHECLPLPRHLGVIPFD